MHTLLRLWRSCCFTCCDVRASQQTAITEAKHRGQLNWESTDPGILNSRPFGSGWRIFQGLLFSDPGLSGWFKDSVFPPFRGVLCVCVLVPHGSSSWWGTWWHVRALGWWSRWTGLATPRRTWRGWWCGSGWTSTDVGGPTAPLCATTLRTCWRATRGAQWCWDRWTHSWPLTSSTCSPCTSSARTQVRGHRPPLHLHLSRTWLSFKSSLYFFFKTWVCSYMLHWLCSKKNKKTFSL